MSSLERFREILPLIHRPDLFIDVGPGNKLNTEAWGVAKSWPETLILGYEPCVARFEKIRSEYPGTLVNMAVSDKIGDIVGFENIHDFKVNFEVDCKAPYVETTIQSTTIDQIVKENTPAEKVFIWADVEGAELYVILGAIESLKKGLVVGLNLEFWPDRLHPSKGWGSPKTMVKMLDELGYAPYEDFDNWNQETRDFLFLPKDPK